jgi:potassium voltage-gated channel Eag-related subfamily H protein 8
VFKGAAPRFSSVKNKETKMKKVYCQKRLSKLHDTAVGPDEIHYQILRHLPENTLKCLLSIFNKIWESGNFPKSWKEATIIPILKPGKDHSDPSNSRPIALTSCICKTMERIINDRLVWFLELQNLLADIQCGFRSQRSTFDHLVKLEYFFRDAFIFIKQSLMHMIQHGGMEF